MSRDRSRNRKLLVSVFNAQEAREAVVGGARIIDSEDPRSALGNIKPRHIMDVCRAVLDHKRDFDVQLSTNIGEDQLLFDRAETGQAIQKSPYEIAGKAAQAALGVAVSMGTHVHECSLVKVGVDGMPADLVEQVLSEVVLTLQRTRDYRHCNVMSVLFAQDLNIWNSRKRLPYVRQILVGLREFHHTPNLDDSDDAFDLLEEDYLVRTLRDETGAYLYGSQEEVPSKPEVLAKLQELGVLPKSATGTIVCLNELFPHEDYFPGVSAPEKRTSKDVIAAMIDATARAGAHSIMLDTRIQSKVARISLAKTSEEGLIDLNSLDMKAEISREGVLPLEDLKFFVDYCHHRELEANLAGSFQSYHAQQVWLQIPALDQISTRGGSSAVRNDPRGSTDGSDTRQHRVTHRDLVRGLVPPEQGGVLNVPISMREHPKGPKMIDQFVSMLRAKRREQRLPELQAFYVDRFGVQSSL